MSGAGKVPSLCVCTSQDPVTKPLATHLTAARIMKINVELVESCGEKCVLSVRVCDGLSV